MINIFQSPPPMPFPTARTDWGGFQQIAEKTGKVIDFTNKVIDAINNPIIIWNHFVPLSFYICSIGGLICIIIGGVSGHKKIMQWGIVFGMAYVIIKVVDLAIC